MYHQLWPFLLQRVPAEAGYADAFSAIFSCGLYVSGGNQYGKGGEGFLRVNVATSKLVVEDGMQRLYESVDAWLKEEKISK